MGGGRVKETLARGWPAAGLIGLSFLLGCFELRDADFWWHLKAGAWILEHGTVPRTDLFSFASEGRPWIDIAWGFQVILAKLFDWGGIPLITLFKAALGALSVGICLCARRRNWPTALMVAVWIPFLFVASGRFYARPEIVSLVFLAAFLAVLFHGPRHPRLLLLLPLLQVFWANAHGLFIFGPILVGLFAASRALGERESQAEPGLAKLVGLLAAVTLACLLNPYGSQGALFPFELFEKIGGDPFYRRTIEELRPFHEQLASHQISNPYALASLSAFFVSVASFVALYRKARRWSWFRLFLFGAFSYLAWQANRNLVYFAVVMGTVAAWNAGEAWLAHKDAVPLTEAQRWSLGFHSKMLAVALIALAWSVATNRFYERATEERNIGLGEKPAYYAHEACRYLAADGMPRRIFAVNLKQAAVCLYHLGPERKVFTDGRLEVSTRDTLEKYGKAVYAMARGDEEWKSLIGASSERTAVLVERDGFGAVIESLEKSPGWKLAYSDGIAAVFLPD
jgi:hypothetical protein